MCLGIATNLFRAALLALLLIPAAGKAQDVRAGFEAYSAGDYATALQEWRPLAEQGDARAQVGLGLMYGQGLGVPQDDVEAVRWYRLAAEQGNAVAQNYLGFMYGQGLGVAQDDAEAVRWYRLAAEQGDANAKHNLGFMYEQRLGVPQDFVIAHMWFNLAGAIGDSGARDARDRLARNMSPAQITEAQGRARRCREAGYRGCD